MGADDEHGHRRTGARYGRRAVLAGIVAAAAAGAARAQVLLDREFVTRIGEPGVLPMPPEAGRQRDVASFAPIAARRGSWRERAPLPVPRAAVASAVTGDGRLHVVGGSGEGRYDATHHHVYDAHADRWHDAAPLPRGANQVGVAVFGPRLYAIGGFLGPGHTPIADCHAYDLAADRWHRIAPLALPRGGVGAGALDGVIHAIGGATGTTDGSRRSSDLHESYDPEADRWRRRAPLPLARDRAAVVVLDGRIHAVGGRSDGQFRALNAHDVYAPRYDQWERSAPLPFGRSGLGVVRYRDRLFAIGGEEFAVNRHEGERRIVGKVYGVNEGYDADQDKWEQYAPLPTPRHGFACAATDAAIHVIGGAPLPGGDYQTAVHDAFTLD